MASNSLGSSGKASRVALIVGVDYAHFRSTKERNNIFVKMEIVDDQEPGHRKLKTKMVSTMAVFAYWDQKFIFSLPSSCHSPEKSSGAACILFRVYAKQRFIPDVRLGVAKCNFLEMLSRLGDDNSEKSTKMDLEISKWGVSVGKLTVNFKAKYLRCIGDSSLNFAMEYDEFSMLDKHAAEMEDEKKKKKKKKN